MRKYIVLSIIYFLDTVDKILRLFGIKLCKLSPERIIGGLDAEQIEETKQKDVALPFQIFLKVSNLFIQNSVWQHVMFGFFFSKLGK